MATDDLVPDEALQRRLANLEEAAQSLYEILGPRKHLDHARAAVSDAVAKLHLAGEHLAVSGQPDDPINAKYRSRMRRECFSTYSGEWFYPFDPKASEVRHKDIVFSLARVARFNGHSSRAISVAEHSIKVAAMAEHLITLDVRAGRVTEEFIPLTALHGILHDAHKAYIGDIISPVGRCLMHATGIPLETIKARVQAAIEEAYQLPVPPPEVVEAIHLADAYALYCEFVALKSNTHLAERDIVLKVPPPDVEAVGYVRPLGVHEDTVRTLFDSEIRRLVRVVGGRIPDGAGLPTEEVKGDYIPIYKTPPSIAQALKDIPSSPGSWRNKVQSASVDIPPELMNEPEFRKEG